MKTGEDFKKAVKDLHIQEWVFRTCSICDAPLQYRFIDGEVFYDSNCYCTTIISPLQPRSWEHLADLYNSITNKEFKKAFAGHFGFPEEE